MEPRADRLILGKSKFLEHYFNWIVSAFVVYKNQIIIGYRDGIIRIWDIETGRCLKEITGHNPIVISLYVYESKPNNLLVSGLDNGIIYILDIETGKCITKLGCIENGINENITSVLAHKNRVISCSYDNTIRIWDLETGESINQLYHDSWVR
jgi:WD40 repeat protein